MAIKTLLKRNRRVITGMGILACMPLVISPLITTQLIRHEDFLRSLELLQWSPFFLTSVFTMALAMTPSTFIALVSGFFLGWHATPYMLLAYLLASALGYQTGRWLDGGRLLQTLHEHPKVSTLACGLKEQEWSLMILVRLSPVLPFALMNLLLPGLRIRFPVFLAAGFLGMLPRTLFSIWAGLQIRDLLQLLENPGDSSISAILVLLLTVISVSGLLVIFQRASVNLLQNSRADH